MIPPLLPGRARTAANRRVLVVEDDRALSAAVCDLLGREGFDVEAAPDADLALELCGGARPFACVLSDQALGRTSGIALLARLRELRPQTTRILMTGDGDAGVLVRAVSSGSVFRFLRKPCGPPELIEAVRAGCEEFQERERARERAEALAFAREVLQEQLSETERRLEDEMECTSAMQALARDLAAAETLEAVALLAAEAVSSLLGGRPARVEISAGFAGGRAVGADAAGGPPGRLPLAASAWPAAIYVEAPSGLTPRDRRILGTVASSTSLAAESARRAGERDRAEHATVFALARLAERRDDETGRHLARVSEYCRLTAEGLRGQGIYADQLDDAFVADLVRSAPLHDIGKVGIPDAVLRKPGRLDAAEWEIMRRHTVIGGDTLRSIIEGTPRPGFLRVAHDIALYHHERWDGSGYPTGLARHDIPLAARIVALADVYDALTTRRPYKEPWSHADAATLIASERGKHFDPAVADVFAARADLFDAVRRALPDETAAEPGERE